MLFSQRMKAPVRLDCAGFEYHLLITLAGLTHQSKRNPITLRKVK